MNVVFGVEDGDDIASGIRQGGIEPMRLVDRPVIKHHDVDVVQPVLPQFLDLPCGRANGALVVY